MFIVGLLLLANLFFGNGLLHLLDPWEADFLRFATSATDISSIPALIQQQLVERFGPDSNYLRLSGIGILLFALFAFISLCRPLFGRETMLAFFLVCAASPVLIFLMKLAIPDTWLAAIHLISIPLLLRSLKQDDKLWAVGFGLMILVGGAIHGLNTLVWFACWLLSLAFLHPEGKKLWHLKYWWPLPLLIMQVIWLSPGEGWLFHWGSLSPFAVLAFSFGMAVIWMGFLFGSFRDLVWKLRKKEEASLLMLCWLIAGLCTFSMTIGLLFCLLIAKQLQLFFHQKYPWESWIKTPAIITLIFFFLIAVALVFNNYESFGKGALKYSLIVIGIFWATALWSVVGIFARDRSWILGGKSMTGLVPLFFGVILLLPFFEEDNTWQTALFTQEIPKYEADHSELLTQALYLPDSLSQDRNAKLLAELAGWRLTERQSRGGLGLFPLQPDTDKRDIAEAFSLWIPSAQDYKRFYLKKMD